MRRYCALLILTAFFFTGCFDGRGSKNSIKSERFFGISFDEPFDSRGFVVERAANGEIYYEKSVDYEKLDSLSVHPNKEGGIKKIVVSKNTFSGTENPYDLACPLFQNISQKYGNPTCVDKNMRLIGKVGES